MKVLLQSLSLFPADLLLGTKRLVKEVKESGFDGLELINFSHRGLAKILEMAERCRDEGLEFHAHQLWGYRQNPALWVNKAFRLARLIPLDGSNLIAQFGDHLDVPMVVYSDHMREASSTPGMWVQTCCTHHKGRPAVPYSVFKSTVLERGIPLVFDNQHQLEYRNDLISISELPMDSDVLFDQVSEDWSTFRHLIREIHLCDFDQSLGPERGRNVPLSQGRFPLVRFIEMVECSNWDGFVVPEVKPNVLGNLSSRSRAKFLHALSDQVRDLL